MIVLMYVHVQVCVYICTYMILFCITCTCCHKAVISILRSRADVKKKNPLHKQGNVFDHIAQN